ncbi:hypothetical protein XBFM1_1970026 [Xenorhabdus bovienii str. feltiae Moldova]|uniref:Uncharacterized protein n=1 Tax=Xenorhabdus bovienii str. feltiae Moldova TaxID=1398200 RepID=A0A077NFX7_XENBV|nr:hypothetical protein XBFM1_1970026 [Xenorhabdus bovienii str. feltiae Moldova]
MKLPLELMSLKVIIKRQEAVEKKPPGVWKETFTENLGYNMLFRTTIFAAKQVQLNCIISCVTYNQKVMIELAEDFVALPGGFFHCARAKYTAV